MGNKLTCYGAAKWLTKAQNRIIFGFRGQKVGFRAIFDRFEGFFDEKMAQKSFLRPFWGLKGQILGVFEGFGACKAVFLWMNRKSGIFSS